MAMITLKQIVVRAPAPLREALQDLTDRSLLTRCAGLRPGPLDTPDRVHQTHPSGARPPVDDPRRGNRDTRRHLERLPTETSPTLRASFGVGAHTAAEMLILFGDKPGPDSFRSRLRKTLRRLSHPGLVRDDHWPAPPQSGRPPTGQPALYRAVIVRLRFHQPTVNYVARRGGRRTKRDIIRCEALPRPRDLPRHDRLPSSPTRPPPSPVS